MQRQDISLPLFLSFIFISFIILDVLSSISVKAHGQSDLINSIDATKFLNYYNPSVLIKVKYPSFWQKPIPVDNNTISFLSPVNTIGIIIQNKPISNVSIDEISLKMINDIKNSFPNVKILNMNVSNSIDNSTIQKLEYTYGVIPDTFRELQITKLTEGRAYTFIYYADTTLFNQFFPIALVMYNSLQTPKFTNTFSIEQNLGQTKLNKQNTNVSTFDDTSLGIKIQYPNFLNKVEKDGGVSFVSQNKSIGVSVGNIPLNNISESEFIDTRILSLNNTLKDFSILNSSISDLLGYPTQMILYSYQNGTEKYKEMEFWKLAEDHVYIFSYYAQSKQIFDKFLPIVTKMIDSLEVSL
jgi:hypothetical protein